MLLARKRIGFLIDAAVLGFAVGTGFAVVENFVFLQAMPEAPTMLWLVRGLGTATLHGATTSIAAVVAKGFLEQKKQALPLAVASGLALAIAIHSAYNHLLLPPLAATIVLLIVLPLMLVAVFDRGEKAAGEWVGTGLDLDLERLEALISQQFKEHQLRHLPPGAEITLRGPDRRRHGVPAAAAARAVGAGARAPDGAAGRSGPAGGRRLRGDARGDDVPAPVHRRHRACWR